MKILLTIITSSFIPGLGIFFLYNGKLNGTESVVLILGGVVIGLIIYFSSEIQEFSIAGNAVKLREIRSEAIRTIDELKRARTETFRLMLVQVLKLSGGWGSESKVEARVKDFLNTYYVIVKFECVDELNQDIQKVLCILITAQYNKLSFIHKTGHKEPQNNLDDLWQPQDLYIKLKDEMVKDIIDRYQSGAPEFEDIKRDIYLALEAYKELYLIYKKLQS